MTIAVVKSGAFTGVTYGDLELSKSIYDDHTAQSETLVYLESSLSNSGTAAVPVYRAPTAGELASAISAGDLPSTFSVDEDAKLAGVEDSATADQTNAEIKAAYEANADTNAFTDAQVSKLSGIEDGADVTDASNVQAAGALMDSEVTNLAQVKSFDSADYATAAQGQLADSAMQQADLDTKQDALTAGDFVTITSGSSTEITITSNDGAVSDGDLLGTSTGSSWGRVDINDFPNIRFSESFVVGQTYRFTDGSGDVWEFELGSINAGGLTQSYIQLIPASEPVVNPDGAATAGHLQDFGDISGSWNGSGNITKVVGSGSTSITVDVLDEDDLSSNSASHIPTQQSVKAYVDSNQNTAGNGIAISNGEISVDLLVSSVAEDQLTLAGVSDSKFDQTYDIVKYGGSIQRGVFARQSGFSFYLKGTKEPGSQITLSGMTAAKFNTAYELVRFNTVAFTGSGTSWSSTTSNSNPSFPMAYYNSENDYLLAYDTTNDEWRCFDLSDATGDTNLVLDMVSGERSSWTGISITLSSAGQSESLGSGANEDLTDEIYDIPASSISQVSHTGSGDFEYAMYQYNSGQYVVAFNVDAGRWVAIEPDAAVDYSTNDIVNDTEISTGGSIDYESITSAGDTQYQLHPTDSSRIPNNSDSNVSYSAGSGGSFLEFVGGKLKASTSTVASGDSESLVTPEAVKLVTDAISSDATSAKTKTDFITVTQNVDLDDVESKANAAAVDSEVVKIADSDASGYGFVVDEDDMSSDDATKVPTQQSTKAYADAVYASVFSYLASNASTEGASLVGIEDAAGNFTGTTVEEALAEFFTGNKIKSSLLPSYVDDVIEVGDFASLPVTGEQGKLYVTLDDNRLHRWSGSVYVGISDALSATEIESLYEGLANTNKFTDVEKAKLSNIEDGATADQTGAEIKALYEAESNTNAYTDAEKAKLANLSNNPAGDYQRIVANPTITSATTIPTFTNGDTVSYQVQSSDPQSLFKIIDDDGTGITINAETGTMFGGSGAAAGSYTLVVVTASVFGVSAETNLSLTIS